MNNSSMSVPPCNLGKKNIVKLADQIISTFDIKKGQPLLDIVKELGGKIEYLTVEEWQKENDGSIEIRGPKDFTVKISKFAGPLQNRFTIAHELAHYFLHSRLGEIPLKAARNGLGPAEAEANYFAASLLMPEDEFRIKYTEEKGDENLIAVDFLVPRSAVNYRCQSLKSLI